MAKYAAVIAACADEIISICLTSFMISDGSDSSSHNEVEQTAIIVMPVKHKM